MKFEHLRARCFLCGKLWPVFDTDVRICDCVRPLGFPANELACYVTILPELPSYSLNQLPSLWISQPEDVFAVAVEPPGSSREAGPRRVALPPSDISSLPYPSDILYKDHHARCGNALIYRSPSLEDLTGFDRVMVLDMGSYYWSGTLKDPRSWAIVNTALRGRMTDLSVWTAGNAGMSLARLAHFANRRISRESRIQIHAIVDNDVAPEIRTQLRLWQCEVLDVFRQDKPVLNPGEIRSLVTTRLRRSRRQLDEASYWHVTDGWDGVGLLMYRLIAAQVIRDLGAELSRDSHGLDIVVPVGTGDLLLGFYLGLRDCEEAGAVTRGACRLIGALPAGANILNNVRQRSIPFLPDDTHERSSQSSPMMPKLTSLYTPLAPCLSRLEKDGTVVFVAVTEGDQLRAGRQVLAVGVDDGIVAEPSALAPFAALPYLDEHVKRWEAERKGRTHQGPRRILAVNSGMGIVGHREEDLLQRAIRM